MARTAYASVSEYIAAQPAATRSVLKEVRAILRQALPDAEEVISYQIAAYRIDGVVAVFFAGWQAHFSLYPVSPALVAAFASDLARYEVSKGTIRFPLAAPVPARLIARLAKFRAGEARALAQVRAAKRARSRKSPPPVAPRRVSGASRSRSPRQRR